MKKLYGSILVLISVFAFAQTPTTALVRSSFGTEYDLLGIPDTLPLNQTDQNGLKQGHWKIKAPKPNGTWYVKEEGVFFNDLRSGYWVEFYDTGVPKNKVFYTEGKINGSLEYYYDDGSIQVRATYKKGKYIGKYYRYYKNGLLATESEYSDVGTKINGTYFFENGTIKSKMLNDSIEFGFNSAGICEWVYHYKDGKRNGYSYHYDKKGFLAMKINYVDNERDGKFFMYHTNGNIKTHGAYKANKMFGERMYYDENGKPIKGVFKFYNSAGKLDREGFCVAGKPEGLVSVYAYDGTLMMTVEHKNGKPHGKAVTYHKGLVDREEIYKNGEFVELKTFEYITK